MPPYQLDITVINIRFFPKFYFSYPSSDVNQFHNFTVQDIIYFTKLSPPLMLSHWIYLHDKLVLFTLLTCCHVMQLIYSPDTRQLAPSHSTVHYQENKQKQISLQQHFPTRPIEWLAVHTWVVERLLHRVGHVRADTGAAAFMCIQSDSFCKELVITY